MVAGRQLHSYKLVREQHTPTVSSVESQNSSLSGALREVPTYAPGQWDRLCNAVTTIRQGSQNKTVAHPDAV